MKKLLVGATVAAALLAALPAQAVSVSFNYTNTNVAGGDGSGKTSPFLTAKNVAKPGSNLFVETFSGLGGSRNSQGCGLDAPAGLVAITGGTYGFRKGSVYGAAAPAGDTTCFAYGPAIGGPLPDEVNIDYSGLIARYGKGRPLNYLGLYYGSIDNYNDLVFYNADGGVITTVTGDSLISQFKGISGNKTSDSSNIYVNLFFTAAEEFTSFSFMTSKPAFEMDNVVIGFDVRAVPEPGSFALLGLGLAALGLIRRRKT